MNCNKKKKKTIGLDHYAKNDVTITVFVVLQLYTYVEDRGGGMCGRNSTSFHKVRVPQQLDNRVESAVIKRS